MNTSLEIAFIFWLICLAFSGEILYNAYMLHLTRETINNLILERTWSL